MFNFIFVGPRWQGSYRALCYFVALFILFVGLGNAAYANNVITTSSGQTSFTPSGGSVVIDPSLSMIADDEGRIASATVQITNFISGQDVLSGTAQHGISLSWNAGTGTLNLTGVATTSQYGDVMKSVTYNNLSGAPNTTNRTISFTLTPAGAYSGTNHFYQSVAALQISWPNARDAAASRTYLGLTGYLVTITSAGENDHVFSLTSHESEWIGANDADQEGVWRWVTGPEAGTQFWSGNQFGSAVNGMYNNWISPGAGGTSPGAPNNLSHHGGEDYGEILGPTVPAFAQGVWNDQPRDSDLSSDAYIVEYGAPGADASTLVVSATKTINFPDTIAPTVVIQNTPASVTNTAPFNVTFDFSEDVTGFAISDITVGNGSASNIIAVDGNTYTADISPSGAGDITIDVAAGVAQDGAGNDNEAAPQVTVTYIGQGTIKIVKVTSPALAGNDRFEYSSTDADLDAISLTTVSNIATSAIFAKTAGSYTLTEDTLKSWRLDAIACTGDDDGGSVIDVNARKVTIDLDGAEAIVCTFTSVREEDYVRTRTKRVIGNFMARRADQITANEPDLVGRLSKQGDGSSGSPVSFTGNGNEFRNSFTFSTSLRQLVGSREQAKAKQRRILGSMMSLGQQSLVSQYGSGLLPGFDIWVQGKWAHSTSETRGTDLGLLYTGVEYQLSPSLLVGVIGQIDWSDETDKTEDIAVDGKGWMVGPYLVAKLHDNLLFDGRVAWGRSSNHVNPMGLYSDGFDASRWLVRGQLTGDFAYDNWRFSPHVRVIYFEEEQKAYIDSLGIDIPGQTISLGRMTFGPKISYGFKTDDGLSIAPHIGIKGIWDFQRADIVDLDTGAITNSDESWRARVEGGVTASFTNGWSLNGQGFYDGIGSDSLEAYGGSVKLSIPMN